MNLKVDSTETASQSVKDMSSKRIYDGEKSLVQIGHLCSFVSEQKVSNGREIISSRLFCCSLLH